jgi:hypothetical protein
LHLHSEKIANADDSAAWTCVVQWALERAVGSAMNKKEQNKDRISECEYHDRLACLIESDLDTQLKLLRSLNTATKKRRELKKKAGQQATFASMKAAAN